ncbi:hypothetical protein [Patulibacter sp. SYSU D01012]|uniref:hypothetical protein n=1 Tax=Patulibacter sp. SYSU D01012 TaxID=2817381 RepID=UPI001B3022ED|nr:hypothetical protein [Patulibacter sp. SYSU D01012]
MSARDLTQHAEWEASGGPEAARAALLEAVARRGGTVVSQTDRRLEARFGSRLAARLGGVILPWSRRRLPVRVRLELEDVGAGRVRVRATADEDPGWNAVSLQNRVDPYQRAMAEAVEDLRRATAPAAG